MWKKKEAWVAIAQRALTPRACACGADGVSLRDIVEPQLVAEDRARSTSGGREGIPMLVAACTRCHALTFYAQSLGLVYRV